MKFDQLDKQAVNAIRALAVEAINLANSGHPGLPMGAAPMVYALWSRHMHLDPKQSKWPNRDRFVLSAGHGSAMLYSLLHLSGFDVTLDDLKAFRQLGARTPGHPEYGYTDGVEASTGPLGQGLANAVGMAMAEAHLGAMYNREETIIDHYTYALVGDGCLMEGITSEASSLAGHLKLGKLIVLYDSNDVSLDGPTSKAFTEDVKARYLSYGWQVLRVEDGEDLEEISQAIEEAKKETERPTLIEVRTVIGYGAPNAGTSKVHGAPVGEEGAKAAFKVWGWEAKPFEVKDEIYNRFKEVIGNDGERERLEWEKTYAVWKEKNPELAKQLEDARAGKLPENLYDMMPQYEEGDAAMATRATSSAAIQKLAEAIPQLWGGSADLSGSNKTMITGGGDFAHLTPEGRNIWYGVREFAMGAIMNGIMLYGGSLTFAGTFFVFSDYLRPAVRMAALSELAVIYVFTHDSIAVGEDGPTHEPVEHLASFRCMPGVDVIRPADGNEVNAAWVAALCADVPTLLVLSRQNLPVLPNSRSLAKEGVAKGAYILKKEKEHLDGILIATGSEVSLAISAGELLEKEGYDVRVVSMPSWYRFEQQDEAYRSEVLPNECKSRMSIELGSVQGWREYVGDEGIAFGLHGFGTSGKASDLMEHFGFTPQNVAETFKNHFGKGKETV